MTRSPIRRSPRSRTDRFRNDRPRSPRLRSPVGGKGGSRHRPSPRRLGGGGPPGGPRHGRPRSPMHPRGGGPRRAQKKRKMRNRIPGGGGRGPRNDAPLSGGNSMPVASMRMRMDDYVPPRGRRLLPKMDHKKSNNEGGPVDQTLARARREATTRTKNTFWTKKLLDAEDDHPNRWIHSGFKELYREELGYSDQGNISPDERDRDKNGNPPVKGQKPRSGSRSKGSPRGRGGSPKGREGSQTLGSPRPKDPRLTGRKGMGRGSSAGKSRSPRDPRRRSRSRSPLRSGASPVTRGRRRERSYSGSSYTSSSTHTSSSRSYSRSYSSYSRSSSSSGSSYTSSSSSRSRGRRSYPRSPSPHPPKGKRRAPPAMPGSPPPGGQVRVKHKETTKKFVTKTTVTRSVRPPPSANTAISGPVGPKISKTRPKKEGSSKKTSHRIPQIIPADPEDPGGFFEDAAVVRTNPEPVSYGPQSPRMVGHLDPHHRRVVAPNHPEYHGGRRESEDEDSHSSGSSEDEGPRKLTLSERFGKLAQLSSQRQEYDGVRMKIVREGGQDKKVYLEDGRGGSPSSTGSITRIRPGAHERWLEEHGAEYHEYRRRYGEVRNWDPHRDLPRELPPDWDDVHVRYRYYKESGYFGDRNISMKDYLKWEEWWYRYRDWLEKYGDKQGDWNFSGSGYDSEARAGQSARWPSRGVSGEQEDRKRRRY